LWRLPLLIVGLSGPNLKQIATVDPLSAPTTKMNRRLGAQRVERQGEGRI